MNTPAIDGNNVGRARWLVPAALFVSVYVAFLDRLNMSLALSVIAEDFGWATEEVGRRGGLLLGVFFIGYGISTLFLSSPAARLGPRRCLLLVVVLFSCFTMLGAPLGGSVLAFAATRLLLGLSEGVHFPMMTSITKRWFPTHERSRANGIWIAGAMLATITAPVILVPIIDQFGWRTMLVSVGLLGMAVTFPCLWLFVHDGPRVSPWIGPAEAEYIESGSDPEDPAAAGWGFLRRGVFWLAACGGTLNNFCMFGVLLWLPTYFTKGRGLPYADLSYAVSVPYSTGLVGIALAAWLGDRFQRRALLAGCGFLLASASIYLGVRTPSLYGSLFFFSTGVFFHSFFTAQEYALLQRILPVESVGRGTGVYNGVATLIGGLLGTMIVGAVVSATGDYGDGILTVVAAMLAASVVLLLLDRILRY